MTKLTAEHFRFRFVVRGSQAAALAAVAVGSLLRCHPSVHVVVIDANDEPAIMRGSFAESGDLVIVHVPPGDDEVARVVGRGSRQHLFYWRHSPHVREVLPKTGTYDVHADCDIVFLRPLDLPALLNPLEHGRIAATVDESSVDYYTELGALSRSKVAATLPNAGAGGPLIQSGLVFTNPADDGNIYDRFWELAVRGATSGLIGAFPWDDMCILTALLNQGGPLWERLLPLGHEWDFITDAHKDPGIFGVSAHYGGHVAKKLLVACRGNIFPIMRDQPGEVTCWGTAAVPEVSNRAYCLDDHGYGGYASPGRDRPGTYLLPIPFTLSWQTPASARYFRVSGVVEPHGGNLPPLDVTLLVYIDGHLEYRLTVQDAAVDALLPLNDAETITVIGLADTPGRMIRLEEPFREPATATSARRSECVSGGWPTPANP